MSALLQVTFGVLAGRYPRICRRAVSIIIARRGRPSQGPKPGVLNTLPERIALARREGFDYADFLQIVLADEVGRFILAARAFIAEVEREKIAERTMRGKEERARSGRIPQAFGRGWYGYTYNPDTGRREIEPFQAALVRRIFERYDGTRSFPAVAGAQAMRCGPKPSLRRTA